ncbi:hypothetical protein H4R34_001293 [Dimargaris verticillata]|uniref:Transmembrane protein n=1 Tax=Dimargaris verticillata TaxID=2761393 RepID=A0A9W8B5R2_9FUNG|nr:hypothetical protein H4R34_001293 [Dimargaris verticillata]
MANTPGRKMRVIGPGVAVLALVVTLASSRPYPASPTPVTNYGAIARPGASHEQSQHYIIDMSHLSEHMVPCSSSNANAHLPDGPGSDNDNLASQQASDRASVWSASTANTDKSDTESVATLAPLERMGYPGPRPYDAVGRTMGVTKAIGLSTALGCLALLSCLESLDAEQSES